MGTEEIQIRDGLEPGHHPFGGPFREEQTRRNPRRLQAPLVDLDDPIDRELKAIQQAFLDQLPTTLREIETRWHTCRTNPAPDSDQLHELHRRTHSLTGESATFGFDALTEVARSFEAGLDDLWRGRGNRDLGELDRRFGLLAATAQRVAGGALPPLPERLVGPSRPQPSEQRPQILLVEDDPGQAELLRSQLEQYGFSVFWSSLEGLEEDMHRLRPQAVLVDIMLAEGPLAGVESVARLRRAYPHPFATIFVSVRSDMEARLQAHRVGVDAYFTKPLDVALLVETLDQLLVPMPRQPYRLVVVDDDPEVGRYHQGVLEAAGMQVTLVQDPFDTLDAIQAVRPDLLLLDLHMPGCSGLELAAVLREHDAHLRIPILFLSSDDDRERQLEALSQGGEEFLSKSIDPVRLVERVRPRARRGRLLSSMVYRDGLTGLMNHSWLKEHLPLEVKRAQRENQPLTLAMLDLDEFKQINDTYLHTTGDRVLRSLARLLKTRLRQTDLVARYGGDELAIVLPNTSAGDAHRILDAIRESFAQLVHAAEGTSFQTTLSCGIAALPESPTLHQLTEDADRALFEAKRRGRNTTVLATMAPAESDRLSVVCTV